MSPVFRLHAWAPRSPVLPPRESRLRQDTPSQLGGGPAAAERREGHAGAPASGRRLGGRIWQSAGRVGQAEFVFLVSVVVTPKVQRILLDT